MVRNRFGALAIALQRGGCVFWLGLMSLLAGSGSLLAGSDAAQPQIEEYPPYPDIWIRDLAFKDIGPSLADFRFDFVLALANGDYAVVLKKHFYSPEDQRRFGDVPTEATAFFSGVKKIGRISASPAITFPGSRVVEPAVKRDAYYAKHGMAEAFFTVEGSDDLVPETFEPNCEDPANASVTVIVNRKTSHKVPVFVFPSPIEIPDDPRCRDGLFSPPHQSIKLIAAALVPVLLDDGTVLLSGGSYVPLPFIIRARIEDLAAPRLGPLYLIDKSVVDAIRRRAVLNYKKIAGQPAATISLLIETEILAWIRDKGG